MTKTIWLNVLLSVAVAGLAAFLYFRPAAAPEHRLSSTPPAAIDRIRLEIAGQPPVVLERRSGEWMMTTPVVAQADELRVQGLLAVLEASSRERYPATGLARYELHEPYARLALNDQVFAYGAVNSLSREQYVLTRDAVHLLPLRYGAALPKTAAELARAQSSGSGGAPDDGKRPPLPADAHKSP